MCITVRTTAARVRVPSDRLIPCHRHLRPTRILPNPLTGSTLEPLDIAESAIRESAVRWVRLALAVTGQRPGVFIMDSGIQVSHEARYARIVTHT